MLNPQGRDVDEDRSTISWRVGIYSAAILGGVMWGFIALVTVGAAGDQMQHDAVDGERLLVSAIACVAMAIAGGCALRFGHNRILRGIGLALIVGPLGGWFVVASLGVQHVFGWA